MPANQQQSDAWNGPESAHYVDHADRYDRQLAPFMDALMDHIRLEASDTVLDIGCGSGATTVAAARVARRAVGADISVPLLTLARERAESAGVGNVEFVIADAQTHDFGAGAFDRIISQFGIMFFDDPLTAFSNLHRSLAPGGRAVFVGWQGLSANDWLMVVGKAVAEHADLPQLGGLAGGPGMFALQDPRETAALLTASGFTEVTVDACTPSLLAGGGGSVDDGAEFLLSTGMVRGLLERVPSEHRDSTMAAIRDELAQRHEPGVGVRLGAAGWLIAAHA